MSWIPRNLSTKKRKQKEGGAPGNRAVNIKLLTLPKFTPHQTDQPTLKFQYPSRKKKKDNRAKKTSKISKLAGENLLNSYLTVGLLRLTVVPDKRP